MALLRSGEAPNLLAPETASVEPMAAMLLCPLSEGRPRGSIYALHLCSACSTG